MRVAVMAVFVNWRASTLGLSWNKMISGIVEDNGIVDFYIHNKIYVGHLLIGRPEWTVIRNQTANSLENKHWQIL